MATAKIFIDGYCANAASEMTAHIRREVKRRWGINHCTPDIVDAPTQEIKVVITGVRKDAVGGILFEKHLEDKYPRAKAEVEFR